MLRTKLMVVYRRLRGRFGHQHWWPGETPLEVMVGAILTQNTAWTNVEKAIRNLKSARVLSVRKLAGLSDARMAQMLKPSGYFNIKTRRLKNFLSFFWCRYRGNIYAMKHVSLQSLRAQLLEVSGIGPETADSILLYALEKPVFVVDAYTRRIFSRIGWVGQDMDYHDIQDFFARNLPRSIALYNDYHAQIVRLGKDVCRKKPRCGECPLGDLCRRGRSARKYPRFCKRPPCPGSLPASRPGGPSFFVGNPQNPGTAR